ncbi:MAG: hypothetical protein Q8L98_08180 [Chlamydiales bacterium]|nr:hypothetical protein [Chlamydiales bacterium]
MTSTSSLSLNPSKQELCKQIEPSHFIEKGLLRLHDEQNLNVKIGLVALAVIAGLGCAFLGASLGATHPILGFALLYSPSVFGAGIIISNSLLSRKIEKEGAKFSFTSLEKAICKQGTISNLQQLDLQDVVDCSSTEETVKKSDSSIFLQLKPENLSAPLMSGKDFWGKNFISFRLRHKNYSNSFVVSLRERSSFSSKEPLPENVCFKTPYWHLIISESCPSDLHSFIGSSFSNLETLKTIIEGSHSDFALDEPSHVKSENNQETYPLTPDMVESVDLLPTFSFPYGFNSASNYMITFKDGRKKRASIYPADMLILIEATRDSVKWPEGNLRLVDQYCQVRGSNHTPSNRTAAYILSNIGSFESQEE